MNLQDLATVANEPSNRPGQPHLTPTSSRETLIAWEGRAFKADPRPSGAPGFPRPNACHKPLGV
jgi:hypothetical protein